MTKISKIGSGSSSESAPDNNQTDPSAKLLGRSVELIPVFRSDGSSFMVDPSKMFFQIPSVPPRACQISIPNKVKIWDQDFLGEKAPLPILSGVAEKVTENARESDEFKIPYFKWLDENGYAMREIKPDGNCLYNAVLEGIKRIVPDHQLAGEDAASLRMTVHGAIVSSQDLKECIIMMLVGDFWDEVKSLAHANQDFVLYNVPEEVKNKFHEFYNRCLSVGSALESMDLLDIEVLEWIGNEGWLAYSQGIADGVTFSGGVEAQVLSRLFDTPIRIHKVEAHAKPILQDVGDCNVPEKKILHLLLKGQHYSLLMHPDQQTEEDKKEIRASDAANHNAVIADFNSFGIKTFTEIGDNVYRAVLEGIKRIHPEHELAKTDLHSLKTLINQRKKPSIKELEDAWEKVRIATIPERYYPIGYEDKFDEFNKRNQRALCNPEAQEALDDDVEDWIYSVGVETREDRKIVRDDRVLSVLSEVFNTPIKVVKMLKEGHYVTQNIGDCSGPDENILYLRFRSGMYDLLIHPRQMLEKDKKRMIVNDASPAKRDASPKRR